MKSGAEKAGNLVHWCRKSFKDRHGRVSSRERGLPEPFDRQVPGLGRHEHLVEVFLEIGAPLDGHERLAQAGLTAAGLLTLEQPLAVLLQPERVILTEGFDEDLRGHERPPLPRRKRSARLQQDAEHHAHYRSPPAHSCYKYSRIMLGGISGRVLENRV